MRSFDFGVCRWLLMGVTPVFLCVPCVQDVSVLRRWLASPQARGAVVEVHMPALQVCACAVSGPGQCRPDIPLAPRCSSRRHDQPTAITGAYHCRSNQDKGKYGRPALAYVFRQYMQMNGQISRVHNEGLRRTGRSVGCRGAHTGERLRAAADLAAAGGAHRRGRGREGRAPLAEPHRCGDRQCMDSLCSPCTCSRTHLAAGAGGTWMRMHSPQHLRPDTRMCDRARSATAAAYWMGSGTATHTVGTPMLCFCLGDSERTRRND